MHAINLKKKTKTSSKFTSTEILIKCNYWKVFSVKNIQDDNKLIRKGDLKTINKNNLAPSTKTGCTVSMDSSEYVFLKRKDTHL